MTDIITGGHMNKEYLKRLRRVVTTGIILYTLITWTSAESLLAA